jgi:UDPglucose 6-dehydrogenase
MNIAVIGAGYVGLVTAAGLASVGHTVRVGEADEARLTMLQAGEVPLHEADLDRIMAETIDNGLLSFYGDNSEAVSNAAVVLIALPTPPAADGSADLAFIDGALRDLANSLDDGAVIVMKSTVPVGSVSRFQELLDSLEVRTSVVSNPEFLREGTAVADFFHPDRIVIGSTDQTASETLIEMYRPIQAPIVLTDPKSSEMIKYASNAYLATRITFANAVANLCESVGADAKDVLEGMGYDRRIGFHFLNPGPGYGGSCFPKDTRALVAIADDAGYDFSLLRGVIEVNDLQLQRTVDKVIAAVDTVEDSRVAVWGLAFKAGTDDTRESPAVKIAESLAAVGAFVTAYDPAVTEAPSTGIVVVDSPLDAVQEADVLVIATEWSEFGTVDLRAVREAMRGSVVVDARNLLDPIAVQQLGMTYVGVGR